MNSDTPAVDRRFVLSLGCPDTTGIVARIAGFLADAGAWITEAAYRMIQNNLDPDVAERPQDLVVYGGTGKVNNQAQLPVALGGRGNLIGSYDDIGILYLSANFNWKF